MTEAEGRLLIRRAVGLEHESADRDGSLGQASDSSSVECARSQTEGGC